jgi:hypothetical protein
VNDSTDPDEGPDVVQVDAHGVGHRAVTLDAEANLVSRSERLDEPHRGRAPDWDSHAHAWKHDAPSQGQEGQRRSVGVSHGAQAGSARHAVNLV